MRFLNYPQARRRNEFTTIVVPTILALVSIVSSAMIGAVSDFQLDSGGKGACTHTIYRQEWRNLSIPHRQEYIEAVKCAHSLPNVTSYRGARSRLDDFLALHISIASEVHEVGHFLPWHRRYLRLYEKMLRDECGFRGALPYWDWSLDADKGERLTDSPLFDAETGFGGDGVQGTFTTNFTQKQVDDNGIELGAIRGCVMDGPFAHPGFKVHLGPGKMVGDHCLTRGFNNSVLNSFKSSVVERALTKPTFAQFRRAIEIGHDTQGHTNEHTAGHFAIGGDFVNLYSSPVEPVFFLHHANLDRLWWKWQNMDLQRRLIDISSGDDFHGHRISLNYSLPFGQFNDDYIIQDVMNIDQLCYDYW